MKISRLTIGLGLAAVVGLFGLVEANASPFSMFFLADDLGTTSVAQPLRRANGTTRPVTPRRPGSGNNGHGNNEDGVDSSNPGHDNNGHGNNEDGVDSGNPGNSKANEDTNCDADGNCVDDEMSKAATETAARRSDLVSRCTDRGRPSGPLCIRARINQDPGFITCRARARP